MKAVPFIAIVNVLLMTSCLMPFRRAQTPPPPPGPTLARIPEQPTSVEPAPAPRNLPAPPAISQPRPEVSKEAMIDAPVPDAAEPPKPAPRRPAPRPKAVAAVNPPQPMPETGEKGEEVSVEAPAWRLGAVMSPDQKAKMKQETEAFLGTCRKLVDSAAGRSLSQPQSEMLNRIRVFAQQARDAADRDPIEAYNLAVRGHTLAQALSAELR